MPATPFGKFIVRVPKRSGRDQPASSTRSDSSDACSTGGGSGHSTCSDSFGACNTRC